MPRCYFARSIIAILMPLLLHSNAHAHGFTDQEWAMMLLSYSKVCEQFFPEKKAVYLGAISNIKSTDSRLGPAIEAIEKSQDQMKIVMEFASELAQERTDTERECHSLEKSSSK